MVKESMSLLSDFFMTLGHTAVDFWRVTERAINVHWVYAVDADGFYTLLTERLARFGA